MPIQIRRNPAMKTPKQQLADARRALAESAALTKTTRKPASLVARIATRLGLANTASRAQVEAELDRRGVTAHADDDAYPANWTAKGRAHLAAKPTNEPDTDDAYPAEWIQK